MVFPHIRSHLLHIIPDLAPGYVIMGPLNTSSVSGIFLWSDVLNLVPLALKYAHIRNIAGIMAIRTPLMSVAGPALT